MSDQIAAFVEARLMEDESAARKAAGLVGTGAEARYYDRWCYDREQFRVTTDGTSWINAKDTGDACGEHIARWDPGRVLRETDAKRKRLALYLEAKAELEAVLSGTPKAALTDDPATVHTYSRERRRVQQATGRFAAFETAVKLDAMVYADHPDFRPEWRLA